MTVNVILRHRPGKFTEKGKGGMIGSLYRVLRGFLVKPRLATSNISAEPIFLRPLTKREVRPSDEVASIRKILNEQKRTFGKSNKAQSFVCFVFKI